MGEALLIKTGGGSAGGSANSSQNGLITEIFMANTVWRVPQNLRNGIVSVRLFGGGSAGWYSGGFGGCMNNAQINLYENNESEVYITIGRGGGKDIGSSGGTSSFGEYLIALGGNYSYGGSGGGGRSISSINNSLNAIVTYGGGGGAVGGIFNGNIIASSVGFSSGTIGGTYGGGGGGAGNNSIIARGGCEDGNNKSFSGYGGNGGYNSINAKNGINTIGLGLDFEGAGLAGNSTANINNTIGHGGGGGYGGNGGNGAIDSFVNSSNAKRFLDAAAGGGGGGYGANGGDGFAYISNEYSLSSCAGGGGGGYGGDGGNASSNCAGGGGGYGKYGKGGEYLKNAGIAAGGAGYQSNSVPWLCGGDGICIIQYYLD